MSLRVESLSLRYATGVEVLRDVSLEVAAGEFVSVVGPSGCGKSTLLNVVAGLVDRRGDVDRSGRITWNGREIRTASDWAGQLGYVFQRDTLLPWFTLEQNVELGLRVRGVPREGRERRVRELVRTVGLAGFEHVFPHQLSGGMRQRAQLLRTLAYDPQVVLMDEPFGALDAHTRLGLQREVTETWSGLRNTVLFVTHDLSEAIVMAQRVVLLSHRPGRVVRVYEVPFGYPRDPIELQGRREFALLYAEIWQGLAREFRFRDPRLPGSAAGDAPEGGYAKARRFEARREIRFQLGAQRPRTLAPRRHRRGARLQDSLRAGNVAFTARVDPHCLVEGTGEGFEAGLDLVVVVDPRQGADVDVRAGSRRERFEEVREEVGRKPPDLRAVQAEVEDGVGPPGKVDGGKGERFIERHRG